MSYCGNMIVRDECITHECDLDPGRGNLGFVLDIPSHYALLLRDI